MKSWTSKLLVWTVCLAVGFGAVGLGQTEANTDTYNAALQEGDIVIDNVESGYVTLHSGSSPDGWSSGSSGGHYGTNYALAHFNRPKDMYVEYKPAAAKALESGYYDVYVSYRRASNIANEVPVVIYHNQGYAIEVVNQRNTTPNAYGRVGKGNGEWDLLGTYYFSGDGTEYVRVTNEGTGTDGNSYVVADAVRFSPRTDITDTPPAPLDVNLSALTVDAAELAPAFHPGRTAYTMSVGKEVDSIQVTATVQETAYTSLTIAGRPAVSGEPLEVPLQPGGNDIPIVVSAQSTIETAEGTETIERQLTYRIYADKARNDDVSLSSLTASPGELTLLSDTAALAIYETNVAFEVDRIHITPVTNAPVGSLTVNGTPAESGETQVIELRYGLNTVSIIVTAEDGTTTKEYIVRVIREASLGDVTGPGNQPDGRLSIADLGFASYHYGATSASPDWPDIRRADLNGDGVIDEDDVRAIAAMLE